MRLTSAIWVSAFLRTEQGNGAFVAVQRKGAEEAGAIFIIQNHLDGNFTLYAPAPQAMFEEGEAGERKFERVLSSVVEAETADYLQRQMKFDSDIWVVEIETRTGQLGLTVVE